MADHYEDNTREQLVRLLRERDKRPRFGLVWERDEIAHDMSVKYFDQTGRNEEDQVFRLENLAGY
jgi:hypothetical protein